MKRVVVVGIPLNVISTYALLESGWKTVLGNAEQSGLFLKKLKLPLKISERAWWLKVSLLKAKSTPLGVFQSVFEMGSTEHGEMSMPAETPEAPEAPEMPLPPVSSLPAMPVLTQLKPVIDAAVKTAEERDAEWPEPSSSKPDGGDQETELKYPEGLTVNEAMELERAAKRQRMTPSEVANEGIPDTDLVLKMMRLCQSSLEYTARQSKALQEVQTQLGETASLAFHSESCMRYALSAINQCAGHVKGVHWQLTGGRSAEHTSCKSLLQNIASATGKMEKAMGKLVESIDKQNTQAAERDKQFGDVLLALQGQVADAFARGSGTNPAPSGTPVTPMGGTPMGGAPMGMSASAMRTAAAAFPPQAPGATVGAMGTSYVPPPPAPAPAVPVRNNIFLQVRSPDGHVVQRAASPTRYVDEGLRSNPSYLWCDDQCFRRLL
eukprot:s463_g22.t1